ncbi:MAG: hypothetical protein OEZ34_13530 [Spirochaetia bacterium]|nr:hypothetical protein [Spirochaetia bacterium]
MGDSAISIHLPWMDEIIDRMVSCQNDEFKSLNAVVNVGGFVLFSREDRSFKVHARSSRGVQNTTFLEKQPDVWISVIEEGSLFIPAGEVVGEDCQIWIAVDRLHSPDFLVVAEIPSGIHLDPFFGNLLRFALISDLSPEYSGKPYLPVWLQKTLAEIEKMPSPLLIQSENGSGSSEFVHAFIARKFGAQGNGYVFSPGRLSEAVQLRELFGDPASVRLGSRASVVPVLERNPSYAVVREAGFLSMEVQKRILSAMDKEPGIFWIFETSMDLKAMSEEGKFLSLLEKKITKNSIVLPPLRKCRQFLVEEARKLAERFNIIYGRKVNLHESVEDAILSFDWPGNWDQFKTALESSYLMCSDGEITDADLKIFKEDEKEDWGDLNLRRRTEELERSLILKAYSLHGGNQVHMSRALGISRGSLQYKMQKYHLSEP